ncbi:ATP-binding protein [Arenimonas caeni]|jgi:signal transduction histidine kinase/CheY-like chemotaxis protein|uniref:ATP-binding protein n=1 Tax=Arenimonas caeni TaxID=2058085 RepID=UPI002A3660AB|nr:ATP-binding protein [Arenimonas caeni]MDY0022969.1 ATP-binding protein [Arenimonas caeni]
MQASSLPEHCVAVLALLCALVWPQASHGQSPASVPLRVHGVAEGLPSSRVEAIAQDRAGYLWLATADGLARFDGLGFQVWRHVPGQAGSLPGNVLGGLQVDAEDRVLVRVEGLGSWRLDAARRYFEPVPAVDAGPAPAGPPGLVDREGVHWLGGEDGLRRGIAPGAPASEPLWPGVVLALFEDREGGLWFGTRGHGLLSLPPAWASFGFIEGRGGPALLAAAQDGSAWWLDGGELWKVALEGGGRQAVAVSPAPESGAASALLALRDGALMLAQGRRLSRLVPGRDELVREPWPDASWPVTQWLQAGDGSLWAAGPAGALHWPDGSARAVERPARAPLWLGPDGQPWRQAGGGLERWVPGEARFLPVPGAPAGPWRTLLADPDGQVWLAGPARLAGLHWQGERLEPRHRFDAGDGVPAVDAIELARDPGGALWLATPRGLWRLDPQAGALRRFGTGDGMVVQELGEGGVVVAPGGHGAALGARGLQRFDTRRLDRRALAPPPVAIESLRLRRAGRELSLAPDTALLRLGPDDHDLRVVARLLSFVEPAAHRYRFRLEGYDPDWVEVGAPGERVFPRLAPGRFELQVLGSLPDGAWSEPRHITVLVDPPWWRTRVALAGGGMGLLALVSVAAVSHRARLRRREAWRMARARQQLAEQNSEAKTRFLATLGHEIRTPMTGVLGMAELLQGSELDPEQRARVEAIQGAGRHLLRLVNDTLDLARIEAGKLELEDSPFALRPLLDELAGLLRPLAEAKGLAFTLRCDGNVPACLRGDATRVRQILLNLAGNAIKFCEKGGVALHVGTREPRGVLIHVRDTGPGLATGQQARLFQRFEQGAAARTPGRYGGSGLGLAISQELAAAMGGSISVSSEPGRGATFRVELPLAAVELPGTIVASLPVPTAAGGRRLLLVEDDPVVAQVVQGLLERQGHAVVHVPHGLAALSALAAHAFDAALLDLDLPGLDGLELARLLRLQGRPLPLLAITARADAAAEREARAAGMAGFLRKPVTGAMLADALRTLWSAAPPDDGAPVA